MNIGDTAFNGNNWIICTRLIAGRPSCVPIEGGYRVRNMRLLNPSDSVFINRGGRLEKWQFLYPVQPCKNYLEVMDKGINEPAYVFAKLTNGNVSQTFKSTDVIAYICAKKRFKEYGKQECMRVCMAANRDSRSSEAAWGKANKDIPVLQM